MVKRQDNAGKSSLTDKQQKNSEGSKQQLSQADREHLKRYYLLIGAGITAAFLSVLGVYALYKQRDTSIQASLEQIKTQNAEGNYQNCVARATAIPQNSRIYTEAQTLLQQCQLSLAKQLAADSSFAAAISEAAKIPQNSVEYQEAQQLISQWSGSILETATKNYQSGNLSDAIAIAKTIPESSSVYPKAQGTIQQWNKEWQQNQSYLQAAQKALNEGKWQSAISEANKVTDNPYWRKKIEPINQKAKSQIAAPKRPPRVRQPQRPINHKPKSPIAAPKRPPKVRQPHTPPPSHLSPEGLRILCQRFPLNSRCVGDRPPVQTSPSPSYKEIGATIQEVIDSLPIGEAIHKIPDEMKVDEKETIEAVIAEKITKVIQDELQGRGKTQIIQNISFDPAGVEMFLDVDKEEFKVRPIRSGKQYITSKEPARWSWEITPLKEGEHLIVIRAVVELKIPKLGQKTKTVEVFRDKRFVNVNWEYTIRQFLASNWKESITLIFGSGSLAGMAGWWFAKQQEKAKKAKENLSNLVDGKDSNQKLTEGGQRHE